MSTHFLSDFYENVQKIITLQLQLTQRWKITHINDYEMNNELPLKLLSESI